MGAMMGAKLEFCVKLEGKRGTVGEGGSDPPGKLIQSAQHGKLDRINNKELVHEDRRRYRFRL